MNTLQKPGEMTPTTLDWRERFNELFVEKVKVPSNTTSVTYKYSGLWKEDPCGGYETMTQPYQVEAFIAQLLEEQTTEYVRRVDELPHIFTTYDEKGENPEPLITKKTVLDILTQKKEDTHAK